MTERRAAAAVACATVLLGVLHLWLAALLELSPDEAYYWQWSKDLALAYPDHPPLVAWLIAAGTAVGGDVAWAVRLPFVLLGTALVPLAYAVARRAGARPATALLVAVAAGTSLLGSAAALLATPETPLAFGWALALLGLLRAASGKPSPAAWASLALGTAIALLSKLTGLLLPALAVPWMLLGGGRQVRRLATCALAAGVLLAAPAYVADVAGGGATALQLTHGLWASGLGWLERLGNLGAFAGAQVGLASPLLAAGVAAFLVDRRAGTSGSSLLRWSAAGPWAAFGAASLLAPPEPNWPAVAHLAALAGAGLWWQERRDRGSRWGRGGWVAGALGLQVVATLAVHVHLVAPFLPLGTSSTTPFAGPVDPTARLTGWRSLVRALEEQGEPVMAGWYGIEAEMRFYGVRGSGFGVRASDPESRTPNPESRTPASTPTPTPTPTVTPPRREGWWVGPVDGRGLPGRRAREPPPGCRSEAREPAAVHPGLVHPAAPVRLLWLRCPGAQMQ